MLIIKSSLCSKFLVVSFICWLLSSGFLYQFACRSSNIQTRAHETGDDVIAEGFRRLQQQSDVFATQKLQQEAGLLRHNAANLRLLQDYKNDQIDEEFIVVQTEVGAAGDLAAAGPLKASVNGVKTLGKPESKLSSSLKHVNGLRTPSKDEKPKEGLLSKIASDSSMKRLNTRMDFRRKTMSFHCQQLGLKDSPPTPKMKVLYSEQYKLAYCTVPKAGSTNMKKLLWVLNGKVKSMDEIEKVVSRNEFHRLTSELYQSPRNLWETRPAATVVVMTT